MQAESETYPESIARKFKSMAKGETRKDRERGAEVLYLLLKELGLYLEMSIQEVMAKVAKGQSLNVERLKHELCLEYLTKKGCK